MLCNFEAVSWSSLSLDSIAMLDASVAAAPALVAVSRAESNDFVEVALAACNPVFGLALPLLLAEILPQIFFPAPYR